MGADMTKGKPLPLIMRFLIPLMIGNIFQQFYNMADTMIVGRFVGQNALAAVGSTGTIMFLVLGFSNGLTTGFTVLTAQCFGASETKRVRHSSANAILLSAFVSIIMTVLSLACMRPMLHLMNTPENIFDDAYRYISLICMGIAASVYYNLFSSLLRAVGNSRIPLAFLLFSAALNIVLDLIFIIIGHMGVAGAALATVLAQGVSALLCLVYIYKKVPSLRPDRDDWHLTRADSMYQIRVGVPMALQYAITASGTMIMQTAINTFGSTAVAAMAAAGKIQSLFMQPFMSMGQTMATYAGQNYGKGDIERVKRGAHDAAVASAVMAVICGVSMVALRRPMMQLFFDSSVDMNQMISLTNTYIYCSAVFTIPLGMIFIYRNTMQACGYGLLPTMGGVVELLSRMSCALIAIIGHVYTAAQVCDPAAWCFASLFLYLAYRHTLKELEARHA